MQKPKQVKVTGWLEYRKKKSTPSNLMGLPTIIDEISIIDGVTGEKLPELENGIGITATYHTAVRSLGYSLFSPAILFAAISVEIALNHDVRFGKNDGWINLNVEELRSAKKKGLPTNLLLDDAVVGFTKKNATFLERRNKIAHGDMAGYDAIHKLDWKEEIVVNYLNPFDGKLSYTPLPHKAHLGDALDQIRKATGFLISWIETKPEISLAKS